MAVDKRQAGEIAIVVHENVKNEVMNARCLCSIVLEEIEVRTPRFVQCHNLTVNNRVIGEISQSFADQSVLRVEGVSAPGKKVQPALRFDGDCAIAIELDFV